MEKGRALKVDIAQALFPRICPPPGVRFACLASLLGEEWEPRACLHSIVLFYNHINSLYQKVVVQGICSLSWVPLSPLPVFFFSSF